MTTCGLVLAALIVCGWVVVAQEQQPDVAALKTTLKQMADAVKRGDTEALVDFVGESILVVEGVGGNADLLTKAQMLDTLGNLKDLQVDAEKADVLLMGKAASVRGDVALTFQTEKVIGKGDLLFVQQGGKWILQAAAVGPTEQPKAGG